MPSGTGTTRTTVLYSIHGTCPPFYVLPPFRHPHSTPCLGALSQHQHRGIHQVVVQCPVLPGRRGARGARDIRLPRRRWQRVLLLILPDQAEANHVCLGPGALP